MSPDVAGVFTPLLGWAALVGLLILVSFVAYGRRR